jgi:hypothetical protein
MQSLHPVATYEYDDDPDYIEKFFNTLEKETTEALQKTTIKSADEDDKKQPQVQQVSNANLLRLQEVCLLSKWDKVKPDWIKEKVLKEQNVLHTDWLTEVELLIPFEKRRPTTGRFFLYVFKQEGLFSDIYNIEVFTAQSTMQQFMLCSTLSRRIDTELILTGDYVFQFVNSKTNWTKDNVDDTMKFEEGICRMAHDGPKILSEKVVFRNFYFNIIRHHASNPLLSLNFL